LENLEKCRRAGVPRAGADAGGFGEAIVAAGGDLAEFGYRCGEVTFFCGVSDGGAVQCAVERRSSVDIVHTVPQTRKFHAEH